MIGKRGYWYFDKPWREKPCFYTQPFMCWKQLGRKYCEVLPSKNYGLTDIPYIPVTIPLHKVVVCMWGLRSPDPHMQICAYGDPHLYIRIPDCILGSIAKKCAYGYSCLHKVVKCTWVLTYVQVENWYRNLYRVCTKNVYKNVASYMCIILLSRYNIHWLVLYKFRGSQ